MAQDGVINTSNTGSTENIIKPTVNEEIQIKIEVLIKSLEESMKYLKEHVTSDNAVLLKAKAESLRDEYKIKLKDAGANEDMIKRLEERFEMFFKNQIENRIKGTDDTIKNSQNIEGNKVLQIKGKYDTVKPSIDKSNIKYDTVKPSINNNDLKQSSNNQKQVLLQNYKLQFVKKLEPKLVNLTSDQINLIISKIDTLIVKYNTGDLPQEKKDKYALQLNVIKEVLNDKLDELQNGINLDQLFSN